MKEKTMKAQKDYRCMNCQKPIERGQLYVYGTGKEPRYAKAPGGNYLDVVQVGIKYVNYRICYACANPDDNNFNERIEK